VAVCTAAELKIALRKAKEYEEDVLLEQCIEGEDFRLILINYKFVAAIMRSPAVIAGDGRRNVLSLIRLFNRREKKIDPSRQIPVDMETFRALKRGGLSYATVPPAGMSVQVRMNTNYHTGGRVDVITDSVDRRLVAASRKIARLVGIPVVGIDFLYNRLTGRWWVVELSPDLAISPPEGREVAKRFLDYLFPGTQRRKSVRTRN